MILALKTDGPATKLWLYKDGETLEPIKVVEWESGRMLADELLGRLNQLLSAEEAEFHDLTGVIIFSGPGSFTSLRIGHTVANALADSLDVPIVGMQGEDWLDRAMEQLPSTPVHRPVLPHYGSEAHITKPRSKT